MDIQVERFGITGMERCYVNINNIPDYRDFEPEVHFNGEPPEPEEED